MKGLAKRVSSHWTAIAVILGALLLWQFGSAEGFLPESAFPSMTGTLRTLVDLFGESQFWHSFGQTLISWVVGVAIAIALAIPLGLLLGRLPFLHVSSRLLIDFMRTIPSVAVIPLITLLFGATMEMKLILVVYGAFWPLLIQTIYGVHDADKVLMDTARSYRVSGWRRAVYVLFPSTLPYIVTGLRIAIVVGLLLGVSSEILGSAPGVGLDMAIAQNGGALELTYAYVAFIGLLGVAVNLALNSATKRILWWHTSVRGDNA
ncbi:MULTISPECIES: ABC transporter permease [unclassified Streptomyces]|uniref:ABC transporter permease n=1 Tax=unclassified Streptomyces TaxID=2593676 RepID=UPI003D8DF3C7